MRFGVLLLRQIECTFGDSVVVGFRVGHEPGMLEYVSVDYSHEREQRLHRPEA
jgi:hypothetical protein